MEDGLVRVELLAGKRVKVSVLILVVVDNGLVHYLSYFFMFYFLVLILVVVDNGLVLNRVELSNVDGVVSLNPCCSGQWSSTTWKNMS